MQRSREQILEWEGALAHPGRRRDDPPRASLVVVSGVSGDGSAEFLREADRDSSAIVLSGVLRTIGFFLLGAALVYLFRAAQGRSEKVRSQLIGLFVVAPLFLGLGAGLNSSQLAPQVGSDWGNRSNTLTMVNVKSGSKDRKAKGGRFLLPDGIRT